MFSFILAHIVPSAISSCMWALSLAQNIMFVGLYLGSMNMCFHVSKNLSSGMGWKVERQKSTCVLTFQCLLFTLNLLFLVASSLPDLTAGRRLQQFCLKLYDMVYFCNIQPFLYIADKIYQKSSFDGSVIVLSNKHFLTEAQREQLSTARTVVLTFKKLLSTTQLNNKQLFYYIYILTFDKFMKLWKKA